MQTINVVTPHYTPEITAAAHRMEALVSSLSQRYRVNVFTLTEIGEKAPARIVKESESVTIHYTNLPRYKKSSLLVRTFFELWYSFKLARVSSRYNKDITLVTSPFMFLIPAIILFGGKSRKIADVRDLTWRYVPEKFFVYYIVKSIFTRIAKKFLSFYDAITVTNEAEKNWIVKEAKIPEERISIVSNGISIEKFEVLSQLDYHRKKGPFTITYVGNIGNGQNLSTIINVVKDIPSVRLVLIGNGNEYLPFKKMVKKKNISNIYFTGKLSWENVLPYYQSSSVLFAKLEANYCSAIPSKLFEYLSTGLPIVYSGEGVATKLLEQFDHVHLIPTNDESELRNTILKMQKMPVSVSYENRLHIFRKYIRENINQRIYSVINGLAVMEDISVPVIQLDPGAIAVLQDFETESERISVSS